MNKVPKCHQGAQVLLPSLWCCVLVLRLAAEMAQQSFLPFISETGPTEEGYWLLDTKAITNMNEMAGGYRMHN